MSKYLPVKDIITAALDKKELTLKDLAKLTNINFSTLERVLRGGKGGTLHKSKCKTVEKFLDLDIDLHPIIKLENTIDYFFNNKKNSKLVWPFILLLAQKIVDEFYIDNFSAIVTPFLNKKEASEEIFTQFALTRAFKAFITETLKNIYAKKSNQINFSLRKSN